MRFLEEVALAVFIAVLRDPVCEVPYGAIDAWSDDMHRCLKSYLARYLVTPDA